MTATVDRVNRVVLALLGLALLVGGGLGLARSMGWLGTSPTGAPVLPPGARLAIVAQWWFWPAVCAVCAVVGLLCLWWLVAQLHSERLRHLEVDAARDGGDTWLRAGAISEAVEEEVERFPGVRSARMTLLGDPGRHRHRLVVNLTDRADVEAVRSQLTTRTIPNVRQALDFEDPQLDIELVLAPRERRRLR